jgi:hypothetical protein
MRIGGSGPVGLTWLQSIAGFFEDRAASRCSMYPAQSPLREDVKERLRDIQHDVLVAVASGQPLADIMGQLCRAVEELAPEVICSILTVDRQGRLHPLAAPSLPTFFCKAIDGIPIGPVVGSCGTAAYRGEPVEVHDIANDPLWAGFKDLALSIDLRACWSSPRAPTSRATS